MSLNLSNELNFPWWFILKDPPNKEIEIEELIDFGRIRIEFLKEFSKLKSDISNKNQYLINNLIESYYPNYSEQSTMDIIREKYFLSHYFLRICSAFSGRIESWILETEGDLFETLFRKINIQEKLTIFQLLAGSEKKVVFVKLLQSDDIYIPNELISADNLAVHWTLVPYLVSNKKGALINGYVIAPFHVFYKSVKKLFEKKLKLSISNLQENDRFTAFFGSNTLIINEIKNIEKDLTNVSNFTTSNLFFNEGEIEGINLFEKIELFPPCMRYLIQEVKETGYQT